MSKNPVYVSPECLCFCSLQNFDTLLQWLLNIPYREVPGRHHKISSMGQKCFLYYLIMGAGYVYDPFLFGSTG